MVLGYPKRRKATKGGTDGECSRKRGEWARGGCRCRDLPELGRWSRRQASDRRRGRRTAGGGAQVRGGRRLALGGWVRAAERRRGEERPRRRAGQGVLALARDRSRLLPAERDGRAARGDRRRNRAAPCTRRTAVAGCGRSHGR